MKIRTVLLSACLVAGSLTAVPAAAATFVLNGGAPIFVPPTKAFSLGRQVTEEGMFTDLYEFTLGSATTLTSGGFQTTRLNDESNLDFISAFIYSGFGTSGTVVANFMHGGEDANGQETESLGATLLNPGQYTVALTGDVTADSPVYNGNMTFAAAAATVPEPAAWALMLVGFTAVGGMLRSQRSRVAFT